MTRELSEPARAIAERCALQINSLSHELARASLQRDPLMRQLPEHVRDVEIADTARQGLRTFLRRLSGRPVPSGFNRLIRERAAQRAQDGLPLEALVRSYLMGGRVLWSSLRQAAGPGEEAALVELTDVLLAALDDTLHHAVGAYQEQHVDHAADDRLRRRDTLRALLAGHSVSAGVTDGGLGDGKGWLVLAVRAGALSQDARESTQWSVKALPGGIERAAERELERLVSGPAVAVVLDDGALHALVRCAPHQQTIGLPDDAAQRIGRALSGPVRIGVCPVSDYESVAAAARTAAETLRIVCRLDRAPGVYRIADVLLEYQLSRPGESSRALAGLLDPLFARPDLLTTVQTYLEEGQNRKATARRLRLHPNTVDNRLAKSSELLGTDVTSPAGIVLVSSALTVRRLLPEG
ncbi:PucR family transcriptional regulator [Streptomyces sp. bgisy031]|uniref:PucR family transcriptional regulator n=1 Tax=Streptomyces sp. bgisy031 TaxID=3413772 RepID=UPI003D70FA7A